MDAEIWLNDVKLVFQGCKARKLWLSLLSFYICGGQLALLFLSQGTVKFVTVD